MKTNIVLVARAIFIVAYRVIYSITMLSVTVCLPPELEAWTVRLKPLLHCPSPHVSSPQEFMPARCVLCSLPAHALSACPPAWLR
eukprot:6300003-Amphidinium_carterae.3